MDFLTAGAQRALELAARLAFDTQAPEVSPWHLLRALLEEESRAAEILRRHGVEPHRILHAETRDSTPAPQGTAERAAESSAARPPYSEPLELALQEGRRRASQLGAFAEVGSEHLLWGLTVTVPTIAALLQQHELDVERLSARIEEQAGIETEPIAADFTLRLREGRETDHQDALRIVDAAANRAREGLRTLEDYVRFVLDDAHLTERLKRWRHNFTRTMGLVPSPQLLAARDTPADVGTRISTTSERQRDTLLDVVRAAFKRTQEAVRTIEEFGKILSPLLGEQIEPLRYELYVIEKAVLQTESARTRLEGRLLYLLVTEALCHHGSGPAIRESIPAGVSIVQVREKTMPDRELLAHARRVREWTRAAGALFIMNDRPDLAVLADADGVHVGQEELGVREVRRIIGPEKLVGVSTHTLEQARQAVLDGADYIGVGPVFPSSTKQFDSFAGLAFVRQVAAEITLPAFAIGGITAENLGQVLEAGATRVAVSGAICGAENPAEAARQLREQLEGR